MSHERNQWWLALGAIVVCAIGAGGVYWWRNRAVPAPPAPPQVAVPPAPVVAPPPVEHPIEATAAAVQTQPAASLPSVDDSDSTLREALLGVVGAGPLQSLVQSQGVARRVVASLDNLTREKVGGNIIAWQPVPGRFITSQSGGQLLIGADNAARYAPYVRAVEALNARMMVSLYVRFHPLLQKAYADLGYPNRSLNNRVVEVIDHLLAAPEPGQPVALVQPRVVYDFADPRLQALSSGQKMLVRIGPDNSRIVKAKLREVRALLSSR